MTPQEILKRFEHGSPDKYLAFFETVHEIVTNATDCDRYKMQKIAILTSAAQTGEEAWAKRHATLTGDSDG